MHNILSEGRKIESRRQLRKKEKETSERNRSNLETERNYFNVEMNFDEGFNISNRTLFTLIFTISPSFPLRKTRNFCSFQVTRFVLGDLFIKMESYLLEVHIRFYPNSVYVRVCLPLCLCLYLCLSVALSLSLTISSQTMDMVVTQKKENANRKNREKLCKNL